MNQDRLKNAFRGIFTFDLVEKLKDAVLAEVRREIDSNAALSEGWQLIETAPKDGTWILVSLYSGGDRTKERFCAVARYRTFDDGQAFWFDAVGNDEIYPPTHWMPLPEPPL